MEFPRVPVPTGNREMDGIKNTPTTENEKHDKIRGQEAGEYSPTCTGVVPTSNNLVFF